MNKELPVFLFNGFLDSGKTTIIKEIIESDEVYQNGKTLLISTEEGEVSYSEEWQKKFGVKVIYVDDEELLHGDFFGNVYQENKPSQVFIELNAFYDFYSFNFPEYYVVYQQVTVFDATKFQLYFTNMKPLINVMVKYSTLCVFNRASNNLNLSSYRRNIRSLNQNCEIAFELENRKMTTILDEDLPYDVSKDLIELDDNQYPVWYLDVFDNIHKYMGKMICFKAYVRDITKDSIVVGRQIMTCCEDDIQFYGYECLTDDFVRMNSLIYLECEVIIHYSKIALKEVLMLRAKRITTLPYEEEQYLVFN